MSYETDDKMVSHPDHYNSGKFEVIDIIEEFTKDLSGIEAVDTGNAIKYVLRWHKKNGIQDIKKAIWYLTHLVEHLEEKENPSTTISVVIHKMDNGNYAIDNVPDKEDELKKKNHCGTCAHQWDIAECPRAKEMANTIGCENTAECCDEWAPAVDLKKEVENQQDDENGEYFTPGVKRETIDKEESKLCAENHINSVGICVPDSEPWSSSKYERVCATCAYTFRTVDLEPCKSCDKYSNWKPKEGKEVTNELNAN